MTTTIVSWNVNGIRAALRKGFLEWLESEPADIIGLQEVRALPDQIPKKFLNLANWHMHLHPAERKGYSGVGLLSKRPFDLVETGIGSHEHDLEGRIQRVKIGDLWIVNGYFPNGQGTNNDNSRVPFKLDFYSHLFTLLQPMLDAGEKVLVMGDYNTAHTDIDIARPDANRNTSGFLREERDEITRWINAGWIDTFRHFHPDATDRYSWWSYRAAARTRNVGWRIDYIMASPAALPFLISADIHDDVMGSDHCPVSVTVRDEIFDLS